jgi:dTMP kinase
VGCYIAFAGVDGSGKTTQAVRLADSLASEGFPASFEPNESMLPVRTMLNRIADRTGHKDYVDMLGPDTARILGAVLKWRSLQPLRERLADEDAVVITDRGVVCQYALVRVFGGGNEEMIRAIFDDLPRPDVTIYIDVPGDLASARLDERGIDSHGGRELDELAAAYRSLPEFADFAIVDGTRAVDAVAREVRAVADRLLAGSAAVRSE